MPKDLGSRFFRNVRIFRQDHMMSHSRRHISLINCTVTVVGKPRKLTRLVQRRILWPRLFVVYLSPSSLETVHNHILPNFTKSDHPLTSLDAKNPLWYTHWLMELSPSWEAANCAATFQHFMKPDGSLPCSQQPSTGPYPEPDQFNPYHPIPSL
jgi:hypothetical protein